MSFGDYLGIRTEMPDSDVHGVSSAFDLHEDSMLKFMVIPSGRSLEMLSMRGTPMISTGIPSDSHKRTSYHDTHRNSYRYLVEFLR